MDRVGGSTGARRAVGQHPRAVHGPRARRRFGVHRARDQPPRPDLRHGPGRVRDRDHRGRRRDDPRAGAERANLHVPAPDRLHDRGPRRGDRGGLPGHRVPAGRPLPIQRQEVRRRPGVHDRRDPACLPPRGRCRLPEHRHRRLDARRPVARWRGRSAASQLRAHRGAGHPDRLTRAGWGHDQHRW